MTGDECKRYCKTITTGDGAQLDYTTVAYMAATPDWYRPSTPADWHLSKTFVYPDDKEENEYFEMLTEKEIRQLLSDVFLWVGGMGEYPELLAQICPPEIVGDVDSDDEEERAKVAERTVIQVLRWVLGEI